MNMEINIRNVARVKELIKPHRWNGLTSDQKHELMEIVTEQMLLKDLRKLYKRVKNEDTDQS